MPKAGGKERGRKKTRRFFSKHFFCQIVLLTFRPNSQKTVKKYIYLEATTFCGSLCRCFIITLISVFILFHEKNTARLHTHCSWNCRFFCSVLSGRLKILLSSFFSMTSLQKNAGQSDILCVGVAIISWQKIPLSTNVHVWAYTTYYVCGMLPCRKFKMVITFS